MGTQNHGLSLMAESIVTFAATNLDDFLLLTFFFARGIPPRRILGGQYLGFVAILALSVLCLVITFAIPTSWIRFLGLVPLGLGIYQLAQLRHRNEESDEAQTAQSLLAIAGITLSNGADNIGVYVAYFDLDRAHVWQIVLIYLGLLGVWCAVAAWLARRQWIVKLVDRVGHIAAPIVFVALGLLILLR